ncbi:hypothetical protein [Hydrocarboniphaga sp.]|uniref:hypothetical protein n=1 Tax=Hydrocarboniphaga sp. TaxID=2033016 RepID=UPI00261D60BB|nr:hypothetical protein [Hydrocarboniphaga sp.]
MTEEKGSLRAFSAPKSNESETLDVDAFAVLTLIPKATVLTLRSRSPDRLPPPFRQRPLRWRRQTVVQWMKDEEKHEIDRIARLTAGLRVRG